MPLRYIRIRQAGFCTGIINRICWRCGLRVVLSIWQSTAVWWIHCSKSLELSIKFYADGASALLRFPPVGRSKRAHDFSALVMREYV